MGVLLVGRDRRLGVGLVIRDTHPSLGLLRLDASGPPFQCALEALDLGLHRGAAPTYQRLVAPDRGLVGAGCRLVG